MKVRQRIVYDPETQRGKPVIRRTRVPAARIVAELAGGMTAEKAMREYEITPEDIAAALACAAGLVEPDGFMRSKPG